MGYHLKLEIVEYGLPMTYNTLGRKHWRYKVKESTKWRSLVCNLIPPWNRPAKPLAKSRLILTRFSTKSPDFDGLVSSFKAVIDGLIDAKVIENDTPEHITTEYKWAKTGPNAGRISLEVMEVP